MRLDHRTATAFFGAFPNLREAQEAAIEPLLSGRNIVLTSGTGSGKTEAVMAPLIDRYWRDAAERDELFLLYIAPTKALVNDLEIRLHPPLAKLGLRVGVRHGDRDALKSGPVPHVLVTTPESLEVLMFRGESTLRSIRAVVIDEVHLLFNTQRGLQLSILLRRLRKALPNVLQWAALSATVGNLSHVRDFLFGTEEEADLLSFSARRAIDAQIRHVRSIKELLPLVRKLTEGRPTKLLVFANSRRECERLTGTLQEDDSLRPIIFTHYSSLSPEVRAEAERKFSSMRTAVCVATSTLELGIDIGDIDAVLLWGAPSGLTSFLQRIGRGNRRSTKTNVVCLVPDDCSTVTLDALRFATLVRGATDGELPIREPYDLFGAVGQQCLSFIASNEGRFTRVVDLCEFFSHKAYLSREVVEAILAELSSHDYVQRHDYKNRYGAAEKLYRLVDLKLIYGNFGVGSQKVNLYHGAKHLGEVPALNLLRLGIGTSIRFAGKCWEVKKLSRDGIHLESSRTISDVVELSYGGNAASLDPDTVDSMWRLIHSKELQVSLFTKELWQRVEKFAEQIRSTCSHDQIPYQRTPDGIRYYTFGGRLVNRAIGLLTKKAIFKADDFTLSVPSPIEWSSIPSQASDFDEILQLLPEETTTQSLYQKLLPGDLQQREFLQDWLRDSTIARILSRLSKASPVELEHFVT